MPLTVIGLGNPGPGYRNSRHNIGFIVVDRVAARVKTKFRKRVFHPYALARAGYGDKVFYLVKPLTFMNRSGFILKDLFHKIKSTPGDMVVVCDNLDLPPGACRLKAKGSSGGQKGLESIIHQAGTTLFKRFYLGIGRPPAGTGVIEHVLGNPVGEELKALEHGIERAVNGILALLTDPPEKVIASVNKK